MILDHDTHRIVELAHGGLAVYPATLDTAQAILADYVKDRVSREVVDLADAMTVRATQWPYTRESILAAIVEVLDGAPGAALKHVRRLNYGPAPKGGLDTRSEVALTEAMREETVLWLFRNKLPTRDVSLFARDVAALAPETSLSYLAPLVARVGGPIKYVDQEDLDDANELRILRECRWKEGARESNVVRRYLRFVNRWAHREVRFELCEDRPAYGG